MKLMQSTNFLAIGLALGLVGAGCRTKKPPVTELPKGSQSGDQNQNPHSIDNASPIDRQGPVTTEMGGGEAAPFNPDDMRQDRAALAGQTVYFAYDAATVRPSEQSKIEAVASALKSDSSAKLLIEGNCDERGTEEYNRSLGEKRALAAREALASAGIDPNRIATRSYGEDKPADPGHDESAWSRNRRDEFVLLHAR